jgi:hypothetical protein
MSLLAAFLRSAARPWLFDTRTSLSELVQIFACLPRRKAVPDAMAKDCTMLWQEIFEVRTTRTREADPKAAEVASNPTKN